MTRTVLVAHPGAELYGSDRMVAETVTGLVEAGRRVAVVLPVAGPLVALLEQAGARVHVVPVPVLRKSALRPAGLLRLLAGTLRATPAALRLLRRTGADVVYVSTLTQPWWLVVARLRGVPAVCHVHEAEASSPRLVRVALCLPLLLARRVVVNSRFAHEVAVGAVPALAGRTAVVLNGVRGPGRPLAPVAGVPRPGGLLRLLYVGRIAQRKGVDTLVEAVGRLVAGGADVTLTLLGDVFPGYEEFEASLRTRASEEDLAGRVVFAGFVDDVWAVAEEHHVWVVPSRTDEPFGNTAVEAVLAGRPLVASRSGGLSEAAAGYGSAVLVEPGDVGGLVSAVQDLDRRWDEVARLAADEVVRAQERHSPASYQAAVLRVLDHV